MSKPNAPRQFALMSQRRFAPFFWTQFLGAANDNLFKFAVTVLVTYQLRLNWLPPEQAGVVIGALFILPFLLLSATSGQLADKLDRRRMMRAIKSLEVAIMLVAALGWWLLSVPLLLAAVLLMGVHSTLFGPLKYAYLPLHLTPAELTGGNGLVGMGTFVAILLGNVAGGLLAADAATAPWRVALACLALALLGRAAAQWLPDSGRGDAALQINWNPFTETWRNLALARQQPAVFRSLLGISWLWFFGAVFLANFPAFAKQVLHGDVQVASLLLVVFSLGVGTGALLCERLSRAHVEIGLVPVGALGMSVFTLDLYLATLALPPAAGEMGVGAFLAQPAHWRLLADLGLMALSAGLYSVPMYALIQLRTPESHRARIIAANNILNALFMVTSAVLAGALIAAGFAVSEVFAVVGALNLVVGAYIFLIVPEYLLRFVAFILTRLVYRFRVEGESHVPIDGPALLVCNHVSFVDAVLLLAASPRPIRFLMDHRIFRTPVLGGLFRLGKAIPIAPQNEDPAAYAAAFDQARRVLQEGELLAIFPEGGLTPDGQLQPFKGGVMKVLAEQPVPVVPMALCNLWGSYFSRVDGGRAMARPFRRGLRSTVTLRVGPAIAPADVTVARLQTAVAALLAAPPAHGD